MSASNYRRQLESKRKQRVAAEKRASEYRSKETSKRTAAAEARTSAAKKSSASSARTKLREAERRESEAASAGKEAGRWQKKAIAYARQELELQGKLDKAEGSDREALERQRERERKQADRIAAAHRAALERRVVETEAAVSVVMRELREPSKEKLRVLILGASSEGDLRVGREQKRIRAAVEAALGRDLIELDVRPAATAEDLLDGIAKFRPHIVHFSGHGNESLIALEEERDEHHEGVIVTAEAFNSAIKATDEPPLLVLLNSCHSAAQIDAIVDELTPFAIGMADQIEDADAISYAARFYAAIANGQSISSAHFSGRAALELAGLPGADLPTLASAADVDPAATILVKPPN